MTTRLLEAPPFVERDDELFLHEMVALSRHHLDGCPEYARIWNGWQGAECVEELPYLHVGLFKHVLLKTHAEGIRHQRIATSSATTGSAPSRIALDQHSSALQARSSLTILTDMVGSEPRPLLIVDSVTAVRRRDEVSARIAAAMSLRPLAMDLQFLCDDGPDAVSVRWSKLLDALERYDDLLVYGFTWALYLAWSSIPSHVKDALRGKRICFVHSGGWKKMEQARVDRAAFDAMLLDGLHGASRVVDYYGLVEQIGVIFPLCEHGYRHVPRWADVIVRDPYTMASLSDEIGLLQLLNVLASGAPYHSVVTEDLGYLVADPCPCGRRGKRFTLVGRVPRAETRGCANV